jgi:outer membrane protein assembly factor BamB
MNTRYKSHYRILKGMTRVGLAMAALLSAISVAPAFGQGLAASAWPKSQGDLLNTGVSAGSGSSGAKKWTFQSMNGPGEFGSPAIGADGTVYCGSADSRFYAFDGATGNLKWATFLNDDVMSAPAVAADGTVYAVGRDVHAINGTNGIPKWTFLIGAWGGSGPTIGPDGAVYVGGLDGNLYALNPQSGKPIWSFAAGASITGTPALDSNGFLYFGTGNGMLYAVTTTSVGINNYIVARGMSLWSYDPTGMGRNLSGSPAIGPDGTIYVASLDGHVYAVTATWSYRCFRGCGNFLSVNTKWVFQTGGAIWSSPAVDGYGTVFVGALDQKLYAIDAATGGQKGVFQAADQIRSSSAIDANRVVYFPAIDGTLHAVWFYDAGCWFGSCFPAGFYEMWSAPVGAWTYSSPAIDSDGSVYIGGQVSRTMYAFK